MSDVINAILIILIILILVGLITVNINISKIKNNWDEYKCNPIFIPFSKIFSSESASTTFNNCVSNYIKNFMEIFISPFLDIFDYFMKFGEIMHKFLENFKHIINIFELDLDNFKEYFEIIVTTIMTTITNIISSVQNSFTIISDALHTLQEAYLTALTGLGQTLDNTTIGALIVNLDTL